MKQWREISECFSVTSFGYHIKFKHSVFSNDNEHKCLFYTRVYLGWYNFSPKKRFAISLQHCVICMTLVSCCLTWFVLYPATQKVAGYYVIPSENFECLSVSASFPDSNLSSFWPIFFKLCMGIDIGEEWFGIANELNLFISDSYGPWLM